MSYDLENQKEEWPPYDEAIQGDDTIQDDEKSEDDVNMEDIVEDTNPNESMQCDCGGEDFDTEKVLEILGKLYPNLMNELMYTAPEMVWLKIKHITGVDILDMMESQRKRKEPDSPASPDKENSTKILKNM